MENRRVKRLQEMIHKELASLLLRKIKDPRLLNVTISKVTLSNDYKHATIFYLQHGATPDAKKQIRQSLRRASGFFRSHLAQVLELRTVPELHFEFDLGFEEGAKVLETIDQLFPFGSVQAEDQPEEAGGDDNPL